ncbi:MAG: choice-of-anchor Q domain-containing protein [Gammaproteobacteria bacterium]
MLSRGPPTSQGFNLDGDGTCGLDQASDLPETNPMLGALMVNAGPTETQALLAGSPAIDQIPVDQCTGGESFPLLTDQQGVPRPQGAACDIGAFELVPAGPVQVLTAAKDSFLRRGAPNLNEGLNPGLRLQAAGDNRVVVGFEPDAIGSNVTSATLVLTIAEIANNWGRRNDRTVDAHPLAVDFAEGNGKIAGLPGSQSTRGNGAGVTWNCAVDANIANLRPDCASRWNGGTFGAATAASVLHSNDQTGAVSWDVTEDVQAGVSAWLIKKTSERQAGRVTYFSREGAAAAGDADLGPRLILETAQEEVCGGAESCTVFVTSTTHTGNLGGLAGGDAICQARAESPVSMAAPGTYKAWLSTSAASAASRLTHATVPYKLVDGTTIADDWDDLTDGTLDAPINVTEAGAAVPAGARTWTGTNAAGDFNGPDCVAWSDETPPNPPPDPSETAGTAGSTAALNSQWTFDVIFLGCNPLPHLYCLQQ